VSGVSTVYLGQFTWEHANRIAEALEEAGITWWVKNPGTLTYVFFREWGPRLFVDQARLEEARDIARGIAPEGVKEPRRPS
jgi:Putative prokaryotic signal transducing protein